MRVLIFRLRREAGDEILQPFACRGDVDEARERGGIFFEEALRAQQRDEYCVLSGQHIGMAPGVMTCGVDARMEAATVRVVAVAEVEERIDCRAAGGGRARNGRIVSMVGEECVVSGWRAREAYGPA